VNGSLASAAGSLRPGHRRGGLDRYGRQLEQRRRRFRTWACSMTSLKQTVANRRCTLRRKHRPAACAAKVRARNLAGACLACRRDHGTKPVTAATRVSGRRVHRRRSITGRPNPLRRIRLRSSRDIGLSLTDGQPDRAIERRVNASPISADASRRRQPCAGSVLR